MENQKMENLMKDGPKQYDALVIGGGPVRASLADDQLMKLVSHLTKPRPIVYWFDYLASYTLGVVSLWGAIQTSNLWIKAALFVLGVLSFYRTNGFLHEIVHQRNQKFMKIFAPVWNLCTGSLFFLPSNYYLCHIQHHQKQHYGTSSDPQYPNFKDGKPHPLLFVLIQTIVTPLFFAIRSLLIAPISFVVPKFRRFTLSHLSAFADPGFVSRYSEKELKQILISELMHLCIWGSIALAVSTGLLSMELFYMWLAVVVSVYSLNGFRILGEHKYDFGSSDKSLTKDEEFFDSYNYTSIFSEILYTTGLRYHALHHYAPAIPYHNLPKAHRVIMKNVNPSSSYKNANSRSHLINVTRLLFKR